MKKWELSKILTDASMNSGDRLSVSPDGSALLIDVDGGSEHERKNWDGPQPAIEKLDLSADKAVRISGKDDYVWEPFWLRVHNWRRQRRNFPKLCGCSPTSLRQRCTWEWCAGGRNRPMRP